MPNPFFRFKEFTVNHDRCAMKVTTDACLFGAWTSDAMRREQRPSDKVRSLDIGTGTGLLSLMVAQNNRCSIDAVEIDAAAAAQATANVTASPWKERIQVFHADVLEWRPQKPYDVIFSNPPFYEKELRSGSPGKNLAHHDGGLKLGALFDSIKKLLKEDGIFYLLLPARRKAEIATLLKKYNLFPERMVLVKQATNHQPFRLMVQGRSSQVNEAEERILSIKDSGDAYTPDFVNLLHPYYLYL